MASRLGRQGMAGLARLKQLGKAFPDATRVRTGPPWGGTVLDLNTQILDQRVFADSSNLIAAGEVLTAPPGWVAFEDEAGTAPLPLGGVGHVFGTDPGQPILGMGRVALLAGQEEENLAVTAKSGGTNGTLFRYGSGNVWTEVTAGGTAIVVDDTAVVQSAVYPIASTITGRRGLFVWTTGLGSSGQSVYYYPSAVNTYNNFPIPNTNPYDYTPFQARSVAANLERLYFGNTVENGTPYPQRVRWTIPSWTTVSADNLGAPSQVGMGAIDFPEFKGQLIKILPLKNSVVVYFEDGVGVLENTFNAIAPHRKRILTHRRGLLGDNAVVEVEAGLHFGLFTDGWFFFDGEGWKEAGVTDVGGIGSHKWINTFFSQLNQAKSNRISLGYDQRLRHIHITFPAGNATYPNTYWIYDIRGDRIWPQSAGTATGGTPRIFENYREVTKAGTTWATATGTWAGAGAAPWGSFDASLGKLPLCHGAGDGTIWQHDPSVYTRDGGGVAWSMQINTDFGDPFLNKTWLRKALEYTSTFVSGTIYYLLQNARGTNIKTGSCALASGNTGRNVAWLEMHSTSSAFKFNLSGNHPVLLLGWQDEIVGTSTGEAES